MTPELLEAMETVRAGLPENIGLSHEEYLPMLDRYHAAKELIADEFIRMADAGELVQVKGLEWGKLPGPKGSEIWEAKTPFFTFRLAKYLGGNWFLEPHFGWNIQGETKVVDSFEDGKVQAEQWYRARLAAALEPMTAKGDA